MFNGYFITVGLLLLVILGCSHERVRYQYEVSANPKFLFPKANDGNLRKLKETIDFSRIYDYEDSAYTKVRKISRFVKLLAPHSGKRSITDLDPVTIYREAANGTPLHAIEYAYLATGILQASGFKARAVSLKMEDADKIHFGAGHVVSEVFIPQFGKWVMIDVRWDAIFQSERVPLNTVELIRVLQRDKPLRIVGMTWKKKDEVERENYLTWLQPYLYYIDVPFNNDMFPRQDHNEKDRIMLCPLDAEELKMFQGNKRLNIKKYTTNSDDIYPYQAK